MNRIIASGSQVGVADGKDIELIVARQAGKKVVIVSNEQRVPGDAINNHIVVSQESPSELKVASRDDQVKSGALHFFLNR